MNDEMREDFEAFMDTRCYLSAYDDVQGHHLFKEMLFEYFQAAYQLQQKRIDAISEFVDSRLKAYHELSLGGQQASNKFWAYKEMQQFLLKGTKP